MRFVSLNAWGGREWAALADWLPDVGADILCLQEVTRAPVPSPDWLTYAGPPRRIANRSDLFADVSRLLPDHQGQFAIAVRGTMDGPEGPLASDHGTAFWVARDLAVTAQAQSYAHGRFRHGGWGPEPVPRTLQLARVFAPALGREILFGHVHGLRDPAGKMDTPDRARQAETIVAALRAFRRPEEPVVFGGDFNVLPEGGLIVALAGEGLTELVTTRGHTDTRTSLYEKPVRYADYLMVSPEVRVEAFDAPAKPEVSDHRPLILDFALA
ncbi:MAG: endonuclease/exonuclease/phosphatase family protein [Pseudomonadota bacterium]